MSKVIDGRQIAREINSKVKGKINELFPSVGRAPKLVSLSVGENDDAKIYVNMQRKTAETVGIEFLTHELPQETKQEELLGKIYELNNDETVTAIIVQNPLPSGIVYDQISYNIAAEKDAEGLHPYNLGKILRREAELVPCTPGAIMKILRIVGMALYGKEVVVIGHSAIVGKPLSLMMLNETATTTVCHIGTAEKGDLAAHARRADILVVAVGKAEMVKGDWVKEGVIVIDVGINKVAGKIVGDVKFDEVSEKASVISPVPGGVGPVTVSILMRNVFRAYANQNSARK